MNNAVFGISRNCSIDQSKLVEDKINILAGSPRQGMNSIAQKIAQTLPTLHTMKLPQTDFFTLKFKGKESQWSKKLSATRFNKLNCVFKTGNDKG